MGSENYALSRKGKWHKKMTTWSQLKCGGEMDVVKQQKTKPRKLMRWQACKKCFADYEVYLNYCTDLTTGEQLP